MARKMNNNNGSRRQTFSIKAPTAQRAQLVGDFTDWKQHPINLRKDANGVWSTTIELMPGEHRYRFLVDGKWCEDPQCALRVPNPYGSQDDVCRVG